MMMKTDDGSPQSVMQEAPTCPMYLGLIQEQAPCQYQDNSTVLKKGV